jgi:hypothetical protein
VTGYLKNVQTPEKALAERLNILMHVSEKSNSLTAPMALNSKIWGDFNPVPELEKKGIICENLVCYLKENKLSVKDIRIISNIILNNTPDYLIYGSKKAMRGDLFRLLDNFSGFKTA